MPESSTSFSCGIAEGFYGRPWNARQRHQLFGWMRQWKLNTYLYAPKDDLKQRVGWREPYAEMEVAEIAALIRDAERHEIQHIYALSPGLDLRYSSASDVALLKAKLSQLIELGCRHFALLFDDIPPQMPPEDTRCFPSFAQAHCAVANQIFSFARTRIPEARLLFCPTVYSGRMAQEAGSYLETVGNMLEPSIDVLWTGPEVISESISVQSIRELQAVIRRKPMIWDNLHANDYDLRQVFLGPYAGRPVELKSELAGILSNPNCQFEVNFVPLRTLALYAASSASWDARQAYSAAQKEWFAAFGENGQTSFTANDLELLGDLFYLPHQFGVRAQRFIDDFQCLLRTPPSEWGEASEAFARTCGEICQLSSKLAGIRNRDLLYSLQPFLIEISQAVRVALTHLASLKAQSELGGKPSPEATAMRSGGIAGAIQHLLMLAAQRP